ncbi:MAG: hypothetical protein IKT71_04510 [Paludibacteraceae bacterium]|nr:hypothetical protein [Paludibacteraceae bacterium]
MIIFEDVLYYGIRSDAKGSRKMYQNILQLAENKKEQERKHIARLLSNYNYIDSITNERILILQKLCKNKKSKK